MKTLRTSLVLALVLSSSLLGCGSDKKNVTVLDAATDHVSTDGLLIPDTSRSNDVGNDNDAIGSEAGSADALVQDDGGPDVAKDAPANTDVSVASDVKVD